jgi:3-oxoacyl-[acyl-carrier protein] reductase
VNSDDLVGSHAIVTGASRGLGSAIARTMWRRGASLLLVARSQTGLDVLRGELVSCGGRGQEVSVVATDLASPGAAAVIVEAARHRWDRLDALVNNAAILGPVGYAWENDWQAWRQTIQVDLLAAVDLCRLCVPWMMGYGRGKIVNLSGGGAARPRPGFSAYGTAKAGLVRFSETLAEEVRSANIQVNCVAPGALPTAMLEEALAGHRRSHGAPPGDSQAIQRAAELCALLASPASGTITGKLISAVWDPWRELAEGWGDLDPDAYTLRRIAPAKPEAGGT